MFFPVGAEGSPVEPFRGVRASAGRNHRRQGQQEPTVRFQPPTPVHHHGEKGETRSVARVFHPSEHLSICRQAQKVTPSAVSDLTSLFVYSVCLIWSFIHSFVEHRCIRLRYRTEVSHWFIHSFSFYRRVLCFPLLHLSLSLSFVLSSFGRRHSLARRAEVKLMLLIQKWIN